jgi:hypothetical protein
VAREGIEPPTPAFSGPPTDAAKWLINQRKRLIKNELDDCRFRTMWDDLGCFGPSMLGYCSSARSLLLAGHFNPDCVRAGLRGPTHDDGQPDGWWERRERFPIDIFGQDGFENLLPGLVRLDFALLSARYGTGFLRHTPSQHM